MSGAKAGGATPDANLAELLFEHPFGDDEPLLHTASVSMTAGEARTAARQVAADLGDVAGRAVAVQLPNGPDMLTTMVGVWLAGAVYVPVNPRSTPAEVDAIVRATAPVALVTEHAVERRDAARTYEPDAALVVWTSGTTGAPTAIRHSHAGYLELLDRVLGPLRAGAGAEHDERARPSPNLIPVSMALNAGLYNALFGLRAGAPLVIMDRFEPEPFAALVRRFAIRSTVLPPAAMVALNDSEVTDLGPLRYVRSITAPLSPLQARRFTERFDAFVLNGYGQAEIGEVIGWTAADARAHPDKIGAVGRPHPGVEIRLDDEGHLLVRPPSTATGIDERIDALGYLDTGDLARIDADGFVWIEGRVGDVINRGGNKVFPDAVEEVLRLSPGVDDVAVLGLPDPRLGEVPVACLVGRHVSDEVLRALCREHLVAYKVPVAFHWVPTLPRNEAGKVLRRELARTLSSR